MEVGGYGEMGGTGEVGGVGVLGWVQGGGCARVGVQG